MSAAKADRQRRAIHLCNGGMSTSEIAEYLNVSPTTVYGYLKGHRSNPRSHLADNIRENLGKTVPGCPQ